MANAIQFGSVTIPSGQTVSNLLAAKDLAEMSHGFITTPDTLTGVCTLKTVAREGDDHTVAGNQRPIDNAGSDMTLAANKAIPINNLAAPGLFVVSASAEAADREFTFHGVKVPTKPSGIR